MDFIFVLLSAICGYFIGKHVSHYVFSQLGFNWYSILLTVGIIVPVCFLMGQGVHDLAAYLTDEVTP